MAKRLTAKTVALPRFAGARNPSWIEALPSRQRFLAPMKMGERWIGEAETERGNFHNASLFVATPSAA